MKAIHYLTAAAVLPLLVAAGCGGGGGGEAPAESGSPSTPVGQTTTYGSTNLPGRLFVLTNAGAASLYDLRTGQQLSYPVPSDAGHNWTTATGGAMQSRVTAKGGKEYSVELVSTQDWSRIGEPVTLRGDIVPPKASPNRNYLLTFWRALDEGNGPTLLTVFDMNGAVVKRTSKMSPRFVLGHPAAWLPDNSYVYLAGRSLYRSTPTSSTEELLATYEELPDNSVFQDGSYDATGSDLVVSPDGKKIAFEWSVRRANGTGDLHIWVANIDGTGLHRLTEAPNLNTSISYAYAKPSWSPDGQWIAAGLYMEGSSTAPIFPPDQSFPGLPGGITDTIGCGSSPTFVLPVDAVKVPISWPRYDTKYGIKVRNATGNGGKWVSTCASVNWLP